ncbi:hypothetical protein EBR77_03540 [bacterium]|nr:hypothetical protein [bacterium]NBX78485.1 hypothetical protein [bacterium]
MKRIVLSLGLLITSGLVFAAAGGGGAADSIDQIGKWADEMEFLATKDTSCRMEDRLYKAQVEYEERKSDLERAIEIVSTYNNSSERECLEQSDKDSNDQSFTDRLDDIMRSLRHKKQEYVAAMVNQQYAFEYAKEIFPDLTQREWSDAHGQPEDDDYGY